MPPDPVPNPPVIDWPFWYQFGSPGPTWGCDAGTTPMLDNNGVLDNSVPTVFNLVQGTSYSCKTLSGELTWDAPSKTLTVHGTIYIDGSVEVEQSWGGQDAALYRGQGTIYMSGSFALKNTALCAVIAGNGKDCDVSGGAWDPNLAALIFVAKSKGTDPGVQAASGNNSAEVKSSQFQGVISGEYDIVSETTSVVQGPIISFKGGLNLSQTSGASFPDIHFAPSGAPATRRLPACCLLRASSEEAEMNPDSFKSGEPPTERNRMDLIQLLRTAVERGASDIHLKVGRPPVVRIDGNLEPLPGFAALGALELEDVVNQRQAPPRARGSKCSSARASSIPPISLAGSRGSA